MTGKRTVSPARRAKSTERREGKACFWQIVICGILFCLLVAARLLPDGAQGVQDFLRTRLVGEADFKEAFSAVGRALGGEETIGKSFSDACIAVFGASEVPTEEDELPADVSMEQRVLGIDYAAPLQGTVTSPFGWRTDPNGGADAFHYGIDLAAEEGTEITAFADGVVGVIGESTQLGKYLTVFHDGQISTLYAHCSRIDVASGQSVRRGEPIACVGASGNATGAHLHFELHSGREYLNPVYYVQGK